MICLLVFIFVTYILFWTIVLFKGGAWELPSHNWRHGLLVSDRICQSGKNDGNDSTKSNVSSQPCQSETYPKNSGK